MKTKIVYLLFWSLLFTTCVKYSQKRETHELLNAVLWMQHAAEYKAISLQSYKTAQFMLDKALQDKNWTAAVEQTRNFENLPAAVILDVDETVLDNSAYEAQLIKSKQFYSSASWKKWCEQMQAVKIPGALDFCNYADKKGVTVFYVTNRKDDVKEVTRKNLQNYGFPLKTGLETLITRSAESDKGPRRSAIAENYRILLLIGDSGGDFASGFTNTATAERDSLAKAHADYWGTKWIVLPNPLYGDWEGALYEYQFDLPDHEKLERKYKKLRVE